MREVIVGTISGAELKGRLLDRKVVRCRLTGRTGEIGRPAGCETKAEGERGTEIK